jgi:hypothetical protein
MLRCSRRRCYLARILSVLRHILRVLRTCILSRRPSHELGRLGSHTWRRWSKIGWRLAVQPTLEFTLHEKLFLNDLLELLLVLFDVISNRVEPYTKTIESPRIIANETGHPRSIHLEVSETHCLFLEHLRECHTTTFRDADHGYENVSERPIRTQFLTRSRDSISAVWTSLSRLLQGAWPKNSVFMRGRGSIHENDRKSSLTLPQVTRSHLLSSSGGGRTEGNSPGVTLISGCSANHAAALNLLTTRVSGESP